MVHITVFTGNDLNSRAIVKAIESRSLAFTEISLVAYPCKIADLKALIGSVAVPRVFFDTRHVGGLEQTMNELRRFDSDSKFRKAILSVSRSSLNQDKLSIPNIPPVEAAKPVTLIPTPIDLPDGTKTTFCDITEKLKNSIPMVDIRKKGIIYKKVFNGSDAIKAFQSSMKLSRDQAESFGNALLKAQVFHRVATSKDTTRLDKSKKAFYRLQCFMTPEILNSYKNWTQQVELTCIEVLDSLDAMLFAIEQDCLNNDGMIDCIKALAHRDFPNVEACACQLQSVNVLQLSQAEKLAFGLNLYRFMIRYATIKIGIPISTEDRLHFLRRVKFDIGGLIYSFQEFLDGVLRGNARSPFSKPLSRDDLRAQLALSTLDCRVHFAVNSGSMMGSLTSVPFRKYTAEGLDAELEMATKVFWEDTRNFESIPNRNTVKLAKVMDWYHIDFAKNDKELLSVVSSCLTGYQVSKIADVHNLKIRFLENCWAKNALDFQRYRKENVLADLKGLKCMMKRFQTPKKPENEARRLSVLKSLNILDTLPEERFDRITRMAQNYFACQLVLVSLVDSERQWFKSSQWVCDVDPVSETSREASFCGHAINQDDAFVVQDPIMDDRFADNPFVSGGLRLRFYAGCPLKIPDPNGGIAKVGTLCIIDQRPRNFSEEDASALRNFASKVNDEIVARRNSFASSHFTISNSSVEMKEQDAVDDVLGDLVTETQTMNV